MYENSQYDFERLPKKILNIQYNVGNLSEKIILHEPLKIDKLSDIYLDDFITEHDIETSDGNHRDMFILGIDEFNIQSISGSSGETAASYKNRNKYYNKILLPNMRESESKVTSHLTGKYNFISTINPTTLTELNVSVDCLICLFEFLMYQVSCSLI